MRLADLDKMEEVAQRCFNSWNLAMAAADGTREINLVYKKQELCKAVLGVAKECEVVDAAPVVHAHWVRFDEECGYARRFKCSKCGRVICILPMEYNDPLYGIYPYCHCGAFMDEEAN